MYSVSSIDDAHWKERHKMIHDVLQKYIIKNDLNSFHEKIMQYFQNCMINTYHKSHVFNSSDKMNQYILSDVHTHINTLVSEKSIQHKPKTVFKNHTVDEFREQRNNEVSISKPEPIDFADNDVQQYKSDTKLLVEQEIQKRKQNILPDIQNDKYMYAWLDNVLQENSEYIVHITSQANQTILKSIFFKGELFDEFPYYMKVCTSENKFAWFFRTNQDVLHYEGNLNIHQGKNNIQFIFENEMVINKEAYLPDIQIMQIQ